MPQYRHGETILFETDEEDENGRVFLTSIPPKPRSRVIDGVKCLTLAATAKLMGCSAQMLHERKWRGKLIVRKVGNRSYIPLATVKELLNEKAGPWEGSG